jgi:hypothetical protein
MRQVQLANLAVLAAFVLSLPSMSTLRSDAIICPVNEDLVFVQYLCGRLFPGLLKIFLCNPTDRNALAGSIYMAIHALCIRTLDAAISDDVAWPDTKRHHKVAISLAKTWRPVSKERCANF